MPDDGEEKAEGGERADFQILLDPSQLGGVWANYAQISHSNYEFTLDFVRLDFPSKKGVVVARINLSPLFVSQLLTMLEKHWQQYATSGILPQSGEESDGN